MKTTSAATLFAAILALPGCGRSSDDPMTGDSAAVEPTAAADAEDSDAGVPVLDGLSSEEVSSSLHTRLVDVEAPPTAGRDKAVVESFITMSLNTRAELDNGENAWANLRPRVTNMIQSYVSNGSAGPDLIGLQEVTRTIRDQLSADMPQYWWHYVDRGDNSGIAVFVNLARFEVIHYMYSDVSNGRRDGSCSWWVDEDPNNRPIQRITLRDKQSGRTLYFFNTHYPSKNSCERHGMTSILSDHINERPVQPSDVLVVGDMNDGIEADGRYNGSYSNLESNTGLTGSYAAKNKIGAATKYRSNNEDWDPVARSGRLIDHILFSSRARILSSSVDRTVFTTAGTAVPCATITNGKCPNGMTASKLKCYSDHWAVASRITGR